MIRKDADVTRGFAGALAGGGAMGALAFASAQPPSSGKTPPKGDKKADPPSGPKSPAPEFKSSTEKGCYAIGLHLGKQMLHDFGRADVVDTEQFMKGLKAGLAGE